METTLNQKNDCLFELLMGENKIASAYLDNNESGIVQNVIPPEIKKDLTNRSIYAFVVFKEYQAKGYGKLFLKELIAKCKKMKIGLLTLGVFKDNVKAVHLYESAGFKIMKEDQIALYMYMEI